MDPMRGHPDPAELSAWMDGELDPARGEAVSGHVGSCPVCRGLVEDFRTLAAAQAGEALPPVPAGLREDVLRALGRADRFRRPRPRFVLPMGLAATVLLGAVALWLARETGTFPVSPGEEVTVPVSPPASAPPEPSQRDLLSKKEAGPPPPAAERRPAPGRERRQEAKDEERPAFAPAPPPPPAPTDEARTAEQDAPATPESQERLQAARVSPPARWIVQAPPAPEPSAGAAADAAVEAEAAPQAKERGALARVRAESCPTVHLLDPPLAAPRGRPRLELSRRLEEAGARWTVGDPPGFLIPVTAWPEARRAMEEAGLVFPPGTEPVPAEARCLLVRIEGVLLSP